MNTNKWVNVSDALPEEGKYVLARHTLGTWHDSTDQENVNCVIVKLIKGISSEEREVLLNEGNQRGCIFTSSDEHGNNRRPYSWVSFGPMGLFGQEVSHWQPLPPLP
jgi:hypothetical protein